MTDLTSSVHASLDDDLRDRATRYALGDLAAEEARAFEAHVAAGCRACGGEAAAVSRVLADLARSCPPVEPLDATRSRALDVPERPTRLDIAAGVLVVRSGALPWRETGMPGIRVRVLNRDVERSLQTLLVKMDPGAAIPAHRHGDVEELFMLDGDIELSGQRFGPGDYCRADAGSLHGTTRTENGCLYLALASTRDEYVPDGVSAR